MIGKPKPVRWDVRILTEKSSQVEINVANIKSQYKFSSQYIVNYVPKMIIVLCLDKMTHYQDTEQCFIVSAVLPNVHSFLLIIIVMSLL